MDAETDGRKSLLNFYCPFFPNSVNLVTASTGGGKTTLVINFLKNRDLCFVRDFNKVVVVLCNDKVNPEVYQELNSQGLSVATCFIDEFEPEQFLIESNVVLIFEDVSKLPDSISESINVLTHHYNLNSTFLITQSVLGDEGLKDLLSLVHRVIVFSGGGNATKLSQHISKFYFVNSEIKNCIKKIIAYSEKNKCVVLLELNDVRGPHQTKYFSIINFEAFIRDGSRQTFIVPKMSESRSYDDSFSENEASLPDDMPTDLPKETFVLVPLSNVTKKTKKEKEKKQENEIEHHWNNVNSVIVEDIESGLQYRTHQFAKNIAKSILNSKYFDISTDGKSLQIKDNPKSSGSLLDYLNVASRRGAPREKIDPVYYKITKLLLSSKMPKCYIRNKHLFKKPVKEKKIKNAAL